MVKTISHTITINRLLRRTLYFITIRIFLARNCLCTLREEKLAADLTATQGILTLRTRTIQEA